MGHVLGNVQNVIQWQVVAFQLQNWIFLLGDVCKKITILLIFLYGCKILISLCQEKFQDELRKQVVEFETQNLMKIVVISVRRQWNIFKRKTSQENVSVIVCT